MAWYVYVVHFIGGFVLVNGVPNFVHGVSGEHFPTPFAHPVGVGDSPPMTNVLWGAANLAGGFAIIAGVGQFHGGLSWDMLAIALGGLVCAMALAVTFGSHRHHHEE